MDNFAKQAFEDALEQQTERELEAWMKFSERDFMVANMTVVAQVGIERMNALCGAAIKDGQADTLAEYAHSLMMAAFHAGYKARREEVGK